MKLAKKFASLLLAVIMVLSMSTVVFATQEGPEPPTGTITINQAIPDQTYSIYQVLYLESYNATSGAYAYKANSAWRNWVEDTNGGGK